MNTTVSAAISVVVEPLIYSRVTRGWAGSPKRKLLEIIMVALWNRADHYIFIPSFVILLLSFFSSPNLSRRRLDVCHTCTVHTWCGLSVNLRCRSETCCTRLAENTGRKSRQKIAIWAPSHNFVGLYLLVTAWGSARQPNFAALNRGRRLYLAGRPSRWALAPISSWSCFYWHDVLCVNQRTLSKRWRELKTLTREHHLLDIVLSVKHILQLVSYYKKKPLPPHTQNVTSNVMMYVLFPLPSNRQHLSNNDCLEDNEGNTSELFYAVLCTIVVHSDTHTHTSSS